MLIACHAVVLLERRWHPVDCERVGDLVGQSIDVTATHFRRRHSLLPVGYSARPLERGSRNSLRSLPVRVANRGEVRGSERNERQSEEAGVSKREIVRGGNT